MRTFRNKRDLRQDPAELLPAKPGLAGKKNRREGGLRKLPPLFFSCFPVSLETLVGFGQDHDHRDAMRTEPVHQLHVQTLGR